MFKFTSALFAVLLTASPVLACDTCDVSSGNSNSTTNVGVVNNGANASANNGSTTTLSPNQSQGQTNNVSGSSAPLSQQSNVMINNNQSAQESFGPGVQCASPSLAVSAYGAEQTAVGYTNSNNYGLNASLVIPLGSQIHSSCEKLVGQIVTEKRLDTCLIIFKSGYDIDQTLAPELFSQCSILHRHVEVIQPTVIVKPVSMTSIQRVPYIVNHTVVVHPSCDATMTVAQIRHLVNRMKYLMHHTLGVTSTKELSLIRHKLDQVCATDTVSRFLDDGPSLP